jgi:hypothetical protein
MNFKAIKVSIGKKIILSFLLISLPVLLYPGKVFAVCPVCTVAIGAGLGLSRWLGIDDTISGIWIGGLLLSISFWTIDWVKKRNFEVFKKLTTTQSALSIISFWYLITLIPLWVGNIIGHPLNTILGIDKIIFGTTLGSIMFLVGVWADKKVRKINKKQLFIYQKVVFPTALLALTSILLYYFGGYLY